MEAILVEPLDLADPTTAVQVWEAQRAAYRVEADLIGFDGIPPLHETPDEMAAKTLTWLGIRDPSGAVTAAMGFSGNKAIVDIDRLFVAPAAFRRGHARALLVALGCEQTVTVSTARANQPALRLYESLGFTWVEVEEVVPGLTIVHLRREAV